MRVRVRVRKRGWEWRRRVVPVAGWGKWHGGDTHGYIGRHAALIREEGKGWYAGEAWSHERWARLHEVRDLGPLSCIFLCLEVVLPYVGEIAFATPLFP